MKSRSRTEARPPRTTRLPWYLPESRAIGATPASLEMVLLDKVPTSGFRHHAGHGAVGHALDGAKGLVEFTPQRILLDELGDALLQVADLTVHKGQQLGERGLHRAVGDQPLLVQLGGADVGELAQARDQRTQMLLALRSQARGPRLL